MMILSLLNLPLMMGRREKEDAVEMVNKTVL